MSIISGGVWVLALVSLILTTVFYRRASTGEWDQLIDYGETGGFDFLMVFLFGSLTGALSIAGLALCST